MGHSIRFALGAVVSIVAFASAAYALNDPPSQVGRLAFTEGTVSFHDDEQTGWSPAVVNTTLTSGDSIWTEPNARSEISVAGTRVRMDGGTQLTMLTVDDSQTLLQVGQGRIDIKTYTLNPNMPYEIVTPRGTISLHRQGDYYVEAGSTQDATRLGVRSGAAQLQGFNGQTLTVNPGQVGEIYGDAGALRLRTVNSAPPMQPAYWAARDRQINYDLPTQYMSAGITGYEDLNSYGSWSNKSQYGNVWTPRSVPSDWQPYKTGHWSYVKPWGWTWIDEQPWAYATSHYGRWVNINNRWVWVPPQREAQPVYAPALVDFIGGLELIQAILGGSTSLGTLNSGAVGWFPLGPREAYIPSYSSDRAYYNRLNTSNQVQEQILEDRWQLAQRREAYVAGQNSALANQRFATVVPAEVFISSRPVARAALKVLPAQIVAIPVAPVSAPPAPTVSITTLSPASAPAAKTVVPAAPGSTDPKAEADAKAKAEALAKAGAAASVPVAKTAVADMPTLAKPATTTKPAAPGPRLATAPNTPATTANTQSKTVAPPLVPRTGAAPPVLKDDSKAPAKPAPGAPEAKAPSATDTKMPTAPATTPGQRATPAEPAKPATPTAVPGQRATPAEPAPPAESPKAAAPPAPAIPADSPKPAPAPQQQTKPEPARIEPPKAAAPSVQQQAKPEPAMPAEPPKGPTPPHDGKAPDEGASVTPQAPAEEPRKPPSAPAEQKLAVPQPIPKATAKDAAATKHELQKARPDPDASAVTDEEKKNDKN